MGHGLSPSWPALTWSWSDLAWGRAFPPAPCGLFEAEGAEERVGQAAAPDPVQGMGLLSGQAHGRDMHARHSRWRRLGAP